MTEREPARLDTPMVDNPMRRGAGGGSPPGSRAGSRDGGGGDRGPAWAVVAWARGGAPAPQTDATLAVAVAPLAGGLARVGVRVGGGDARVGPLVDGAVHDVAGLADLFVAAVVAAYGAHGTPAARDARRAALDAVADAHADPDFPAGIVCGAAPDAERPAVSRC